MISVSTYDEATVLYLDSNQPEINDILLLAKRDDIHYGYLFKTIIYPVSANFRTLLKKLWYNIFVHLQLNSLLLIVSQKVRGLLANDKYGLENYNENAISHCCFWYRTWVLYIKSNSNQSSIFNFPKLHWRHLNTFLVFYQPHVTWDISLDELTQLIE